MVSLSLLTLPECSKLIMDILVDKNKEAGAELCQAQVMLEVIVDVVEEAWS